MKNFTLFNTKCYFKPRLSYRDIGSGFNGMDFVNNVQTNRKMIYISFLIFSFQIFICTKTNNTCQ